MSEAYIYKYIDSYTVLHNLLIKSLLSYSSIIPIQQA